jgi:hypothetical protein
MDTACGKPAALGKVVDFAGGSVKPVAGPGGKRW